MSNEYRSKDKNPSPISEEELSDEAVLNEIHQLKKELSDRLLVLGHHYQQDDIIQFADVRGDSLALAREASRTDKEFIIFCGVHFMAETADMLTAPHQKVILPDLSAGCSMADMANRQEIDKSWERITGLTSEKITPITYINCSADLKSFVGEHDGAICTSSNAKKIISWALGQEGKLLFFPDQHLGRNTCFDLDIPLDRMVVYNPNLQNAGVTDEEIKNAKVILWYGYCSVHQNFTVEQCDTVRRQNPNMKIIVHPECCFDVVQKSDLNGSTSYILNEIDNAPDGSEFAVGTEINLVQRLAKKHKNKKIISLSPIQCRCETMYRIRPRWLLESLRSIKRNEPINIIKVSDEVKKWSLLALDRMLNIS